MIQPSSFLNNYTEEAFKDFRTRVLLDSGFFESEEGSKPNFAYNLPTLTTNLDSDTQEFLKATGIKDHSIISHINNYVVKLKRFGLWSKIKALYPFVSDQRNVLRNTDTFSGWNPETGTITGNFTDPLGGATAYKYTTVGTAGLWTGSPTMFISSSTKVTYSFWIKSVSGNNMTAVLTDAYNVTPSYTINITGTWTYITATLTLTPGNVGMYINNLSDPTNGFLIWRPQMEVGSVATTYQPTTSPSTIYTNHFKYNLKDPRDLDAAFRLTFSGGWQFSQLGATPNGTNGYANTNFVPSAHLGDLSTHGSVYLNTNNTQVSADPVDFGAFLGGEQAFLLVQSSLSGTSISTRNLGNAFTGTQTNRLGFGITSKTSSTVTTIYKNGINVASGNSGGTLPTYNSFLGGMNLAGLYGPTNNRIAFHSLGEGLTASEATNLYYLTEELQANLNRNVSPYNSFRGILDEYPGAAAAYSLRRLSGSYGGPLVKVRRSSDNTEQDIFPTASGSLDTTSLLSFVGAGNGFVTTWYDQSGGGYNVTQGIGSYQPQIVTSGTLQTILGKPTILWDGVNDNLLQTLPVINGLSQIALISVTNPLGGTLGNMSSSNLLFLETGSWGNVGQVSTPSGLNYRFGTSQNSNNNFYTASINVAIHSTYKNGVNEVDRYNGVDILTSNTKLTTIANTSNILFIGRDEFNGSYNGKQSEVIIYFTDQTSNRYKLESNINNYYSVFWDGSRKGLLDFYPNAAAAYSVRALSSSYRGPLLRVRRASDNTERDIFALQNGNLDTFTLTTFCSGTDGFVTTWYDQSGLGKNATQTTAGEQPQIVSSGSVITQGTRSAINFRGTDSLTPSLTGISGNASFYFVTRHTNPTSTWSWIIGDKTSSNRIFIGKKNGSTLPHLSFAGVDGSDAIGGDISQYAVSYWQQGSSNSQYYINGTQYSLANGTNYQPYAIGRRATYAEFWIGPMQEIIHYDRQTITSNFDIRSSINNYYTIY